LEPHSEAETVQYRSFWRRFLCPDGMRKFQVSICDRS
jgi:hypothetical protein